MPKYVWDKATNMLVEVEQNTRLRCDAPQVMRDIPEYKSPLGTGWITSRSHRREELKRSGCREVDPSEFKPVYRSEQFTKKRGLRVSAEPLKAPARITSIGG